jgi:hypothetical protein
MKKGILFGLLLMMICGDIIAQQIYTEQPPVLIKNEGEGGIILHSQGFGFNYRRAKMLNVNTKRFWDFDFETVLHPKEVSTVNPDIPNAKSYVYGKMNDAYFLRAGIGKEKIMYDREEKKGIQIRYNYSGGFSFAITKPIYFDIVAPDNVAGDTLVKFDPSNPLDPTTIIGRASFFTGLGEMQIQPGLYYKMGVSFMQVNQSNNFYVLETGFAIDGFRNPVPIMANTPNNRFFLTFYINLMLGKRWNNY